ncbi:hypothetical protein BO78DRAFT_438213 [Aspergillus sclerotiicarbonarius CBS 121057]|uniref:S-adenosyl-L-methionine-dependent methyltransferase n=1 Tax=Aspergillus sclerotiicarbonarius (strain CBS 121057 / IBT 28362) TaxID=1448318 RepID=A0A319DT24_ASPSB|nr:hypothetical protein BO78DRAFT_438213 [Aspergillus sclerotiicarbonarius CBS 121057]
MGDYSTPAPETATFHHANDQPYSLQHNHLAACRLNLQHYLWREVFQFNLHPSIPIPIPNPTSTSTSNSETNPPLIADIACGTALWLIDMSHQLPHAHLDGFDIDLTQAPPPQWLPENITLREWDALTPVPADLHGRYDIVHVRLAVLFLSGRDVDPAPFIRNLYSLLKPGGWVQWDELDCVRMCVKKITTTPSSFSSFSCCLGGDDTPALEELRVACSADGRHDWAVGIAGMLEKEGFVDTRTEGFDEKDELVRAFGDQHLLTMGEFGAKLGQGGKVKAAQRFGVLVEEAYREMVGRGAALSIPRVVGVGRKPVL